MNNAKQLQFLYILNFLKDTNLISVLLSPFMIYSQLSLSDYIMTVSIFRLTQVCFSIPAGILADKFKPSSSLKLSALLYAFSFLFLLEDKPSFLMFAFFNILNSLSVCLMVSSNKKLKYIVTDRELFIQKYANKISIRKLGVMVSGIISSIFIASIGYLGLVYLQLIFCFILLYIAFNLKEEVIDEELTSNLSFRSFSSIKSIFKQLPTKEIFKVVVISVPFFVSIDALIQPLMVEAKVSLWLFPLLIALSNLLIFISINKSSYLSKIFNINPMINSLLPLAALTIYVITQNAALGLLGMIVTIFSRCFSVVEIGNFINNISPQKQSTIESIMNTITVICVGLCSFIFAYLLKFFPMWEASGIFLIILLIFVLVFHYLIEKDDEKVIVQELK